jgi:hypothetical protein
MSKALKVLAITTIVGGWASMAFAQSPSPYGGGHNPYYSYPGPMTTRSFRLHRTATPIHPIAPRTVLIPPGLTIPIPDLARRCVAISAGASIASYRRPAPRHTLAQLLENPRRG